MKMKKTKKNRISLLDNGAAVIADESGVITSEMVITIAIVTIVAVSCFAIMNTMLPNLFQEVVSRITEMVTGKIIP